jgi:predicted unusual protein kinase regulating ubiquinone biosynthesis (AarF/ABC1/UbiB family)
MPLLIKFVRDKRFRKIISLFILFVTELWWLNKKRRFLSETRYQEKLQEIYRKQARLFTDTATELGGLLIKLGQFFSSRVDILPEAYTSELAKLQDAVRPVSTAEIIKQIEAEYSCPIAEIYLDFSEEAIASASLGQVHTARIKGQNKVAVKVLRPGIEKIIQTDFEALRFMVTFAKRYPLIREAVDLEQLYSEFVETTQDELDYLKEGRHADAFRENFAGDTKISVPLVHWEYTTQRVLTMEYITGYKVNDYQALEKAGIDRAELADTLINAYMLQLLEDAFFHADPHPGNLLVKEDGTLVFLDFGMMGRIEKGMREELIAFVIALFKKDTEQMVNVFGKLGFLRPHADKAVLTKGLKLVLANIFEDPNLKTINSEEFLLDLREFMYSQPFQIPARTLYLGKSLLTVMGICGGLNPQLDLIKTLRPYAEELLMGEKSGMGSMGARGWAPELILEQAQKIIGEAVGLPERLNRFMTGIETGELRLHPAKSFERNLLQNQREQTGRIVRAILSSGFLVSGAVLLEGPFFKAGLTLLILAALIFVTLIRHSSGTRTRRGQRGRAGSAMGSDSTSGFRRPRFHP